MLLLHSMTSARTPKTISQPAWFGTAAAACFTYATLGLILMHVLRPDYVPRDHMISDYAVGKYGWVMQTVFVSMSLGNLMLAVGLARSGPRSILARMATVLLAVACVGLLVSAIYPTDLEGAPSTRTGYIHDVSFLVNVTSAILATILLSVSFGSDARCRSFWRVALSLMVLMLIALVIQFRTLHKGMPYGIANRFFVSVAFAWSVATALRLRAVERG